MCFPKTKKRQTRTGQMEQKLNLPPFTIHFLWISSMVNKTPFRQNLSTLEEHCNLKLCSFNLSQKKICKKFTYLLRRTVESMKNNRLWQVYSERTPPPPRCHNILGYVHTIYNNFSRRHEKLFDVVWTPVRYVTLFWDRCSAVQCSAALLCYKNHVEIWLFLCVNRSPTRSGFRANAKAILQSVNTALTIPKEVGRFLSAMSHTRGRLSDFS